MAVQEGVQPSFKTKKAESKVYFSYISTHNHFLFLIVFSIYNNVFGVHARTLVNLELPLANCQLIKISLTQSDWQRQRQLKNNNVQ